MPFTFSHPAIVLPLAWLPPNWVSLTGLVVGSLVPDFEYFIRMKVQSQHSHTWSGLFWFDLPLGLLLAFIFHLVVRDSLVDNLPAALQARLAACKQVNWSCYFRANWFVVLLSLLTGAASHLFWDSFTHHGGYFVTRIPGLAFPVRLINGQVPVYKLLQHTSTLIGGLLLAWALWRLPADARVSTKVSYRYWGTFLLLTLSLVAIRLLTSPEIRQIGHVLVTGISAALLGLMLTPLLRLNEK